MCFGADDHERAIGLRGQMTRLTATLVGGKPLEQTSIEWWRANLSMAPNPVAPDTPYRDAATRWRVNGFPGALQFEDLMPKTPANPNGRGLPSGLSIFDLDSAFIASDRMGLPLPVLLALMETEGVDLFAPVNRLVRQPTPVDDDTKTVSWEAQSRDTTNMLRPPIADVEAGVAAARLAAWRQTVGRAFWLSFPYGLDRFTLVDDAAVNARSDQFVAAKILVKDADEKIEPYIRTRVFSRFHLLPGIAPLGTVRIWKVSRRVHWAILSLMAGFLRRWRSRRMMGRVRSPHCLQRVCLSARALRTSCRWRTRSRTDSAWKDYLTYYGMLYFSYNSTPAGLVAFANAAKAAMGASPLSLRDFIVFRHQRATK